MVKNKQAILGISALVVSLMLSVYAFGATVHRSNFIVSNLSCTSCLATIEAELKGVPGTLGMAGDLQRGHITVDHLSTLDYDQIAAIISRLGYPATLEWTATLPPQYINRFAEDGGYRSACSSGGCGGSGSGGAGLAVWKVLPGSGTVHRTTLQVRNLSCTSCLANIAAELRKLSATYGMNGFISRGVVLVDHAATLDNSRIAAVISALGYPARVLATNEIAAQKAYGAPPDNNSATPSVRTGSTCNSKWPCNATAASWQKLYQRYFSQNNSK